VASYSSFIGRHIRATHFQVVVKEKSNKSFEDVVAPVIQWIKEQKEGQNMTIVIDDESAEVRMLNFKVYIN
jgi:C4-type Zn-finger protein